MFCLLFVFIGVVKHAEHAGFTQVRLGVFMYMRSQAGNIRRCAGARGACCGYGAARADVQCPRGDWNGRDTFIQKDGINQDFGVFDSPDEFYARHGVNVKGLKRWLFQNVIRQRMNGNVARIRHAAPAPAQSTGPGSALVVEQDQSNARHAIR